MNVAGMMPVWADIREASAISGVPDNTIRLLVNRGKVGARQCRDAEMPAAKKVAVRFFVQDLLDWMKNEAVPPGPYRLKGKEGICDE